MTNETAFIQNKLRRNGIFVGQGKDAFYRAAKALAKSEPGLEFTENRVSYHGQRYHDPFTRGIKFTKPSSVTNWTITSTNGDLS